MGAGRSCLLLATSGLLCLPLPIGAQEKAPGKTSLPPTVAFVTLGSQSFFRELPTYARFYSRMAELGWSAGKNVRYIERATEGDLAKLEIAARELVAARVSLIVVPGTHESLAAMRATTSIPVVMVQVSDPVELGIVASYSRPGGNVTGNSAAPVSLASKRMELLTELLPAARTIVQGYDASSVNPPFDAALQKFAARRTLALRRVELPAAGDYDAWVSKVKSDGADAALMTHAASSFAPARRKAIADAMLKHRLPAVCYVGEYVESGCLASYSPSLVDLYAKAAEYADRILRGAKPGDLPIQLPTTFELVVNLKTAKELGVKVPQSVLTRATRIIE